MNKPIRVLVLEDRPTDAEMNIRELRRAGFDPQWKRVETEAEYLAELSSSPDLILADYALPHFDGLKAAKLLRERELDIPFILVSGTIGEEAAVEAIKLGVTDYLLKDRIGRLGPAVERALEEKRLRAERREAQEKLLASEARYRRLFEAARDGILILDAASGEIEDVNPFLMEMLGYPRTDFIGKQLWELGFFKDRVSTKDAFLKLQAEGYIRYDDLPLKAKNGRALWVEFVSNTYAVNGTPVIQCNIRDISERRQIELAMNRLAAIVEFSDDAIIGKDLNSIITSWNKGAENIFGYTAGEMVGTSILRLSPAGVDDEHHHILEKIKQGGNAEHFDALRQTREGRCIDVAITASPIRDSADTVVGVSILARDITERKRSQEALLESEEKFRQLADNVSDVFYMTSPDFQKMFYASPAYEQVWGRSVESLYADPRQWADAILPEERERTNAAFSLLAGDAPSASVEFRIVRPDSTVRWIHSRGFQVRDISGTVIRITGIASDITERKRAEETFRTRAVELERFHSFSVGRELQMVELKKEVNEFAKHAGGMMPYDLSFLDQSPVIRGPV